MRTSTPINLNRTPPIMGAIISDVACIPVTIPFALSILLLATSKGMLEVTVGVYIVLIIDNMIIITLIIKTEDLSADISKNKTSIIKLLQKS